MARCRTFWYSWMYRIIHPATIHAKFCVTSNNLITRNLQPSDTTNGKTPYDNGNSIFQPRQIQLPPSLRLFLTLQNSMSKQRGPVCRRKLVLLYLCMLLLQESFAPEPNPGPRTPRFPCAICNKAVKWTTPGVQCDSCDQWYHSNCMGMCDAVYRGLRNISWECCQCGLPNFASSLFDLTLFETTNSFDSLRTVNSDHSTCDLSFSHPGATSSPNRAHTPVRDRIPSDMSIPCTTINEENDLTHPSFTSATDNDPQLVQKSKHQRDDIPLKTIILNCQSITGKKTSLATMCDSIKADIVIGTESWLTPNHQSAEIFPDNYTVHRRDRTSSKGGGVFVLVDKKYQSMEPAELNEDNGCEMLWVQLTMSRAANLYIGAFYRPPSMDSPEYMSHLDTSLSRIPQGAHIWLGGDFNLSDIDWSNNNVIPSAGKSALCHQLLQIANDRFIEQLVFEPTRITESSSNILDLFFSNNSSLVNHTRVVPGISDHEAVYVEASLRPCRIPPLKRKVFTYNKANYDGLRQELRDLHTEMTDLQQTSVDTLWTMFKKNLTSLMDKYIPKKVIKDGHRMKPWIDRKVKSAIKKKARLYAGMKKTGRERDIIKYRKFKASTQKLIRNNYFQYVNNLFEINDPDDDKQPKQKKFWSYIKSLKKDNTGISPLKDKGRLFNAAKDKANILNRQYMSVFTHETEGDIPSPDGTPFPEMDEIVINGAGILKLLRNLNPKKASGPDNISARILKDCADDIAPILTMIFNKSMEEGKVPDDWRQANVTAIYKKGSRQDPANYRPVSLTSLCCKLLEHVIASQAVKHLEKFNILHDCQHGFRAKRSCETQLITLAHELASSLDKKIQTDMVISSLVNRTLRKCLYKRCYSTAGASTSFKADDVQITRTTTPAAKPDVSSLRFGHHFTDHMLEIEWVDGQGWGKPVISPMHNFSLHPGAKVLHYAVELFEGMKAFRGDDDKIRLFRPMENMKRMLSTSERSCFPLFDGQELVELIKKLIAVDADWVPKATKDTPSSLYIRPTMIGTEPTLGVNKSMRNLLFVVIGPVGPYYPTGMAPVKLLADPKYVRAWPGGSGGYKMGCNYAPTMAIQAIANEQGCQQVLWLFGEDHQLTEVGAMNLFTYWINEQGEKELITAPLNGLVLPGITRKSLLELGRKWGEFKVTERDYTMKEVTKALNENRLLEMFGVGTACVVSPVEGILYKGEMLNIPTMKNPTVTNRCMKELLDIQYGRTPSDWAEIVQV